MSKKSSLRFIYSYVIVFLLSTIITSGFVFFTSARADSNQGLQEISKHISEGFTTPEGVDASSGEITDRRTAHSKTFKNSDGTFTLMHKFGPPVHYYNPNSESFKEIKTAILTETRRVPAGESSGSLDFGEYEYSNEENSLRSYYRSRSSGRDMMKVEQGEHYITYQPLSAMWVDAGGNEMVVFTINDVACSVSGNKALYRDIFPNIDEEFSVLHGKVKDLFLIKERLAQPEGFSEDAYFRIEGIIRCSDGLSMFVEENEQGDSFETSSSIEIRDVEEETVCWIEAPRVYDSTHQTADSVFYSVSRQENEMLFAINVPAQWLFSETTCYPVSIDPTVTQHFYYDAYTCSDCPNDNYGYEGYIRVGYNHGTPICPGYNQGLYYGFMKLSGDLALPDYVTSYDITAARLYAYVDPSDSDGACPEITPDRIIEDWNESSINYDNLPQVTDDSNEDYNPGNTSAGYTWWDVKPSIKKVADGSHFYGFALLPISWSYSVDNWVSFRAWEYDYSSTYTPYLYVDYADPFCTYAITWPNGGEDWEIGQGYYIKWDASGNDCGSNVKLEYSTNGGSSWMTITNSTANAGMYAWFVPNAPTTQARIRVTDTSNGSFSDISDSNFTISEVPYCNVTVTSPNGGEDWQVGSSHSITWITSGNDCGSYVKLEYSTNGGTSWTTITSSTSNDGSRSWTIPNALTTQARVRVTDTSDGSYSDTSNSNFTISPIPDCDVTVASPNGGENWQVGSSQTVSWSTSGNDCDSNVKLEYSTDGGSSWTTITSSTSNDGSYSWTIPNAPTTQAKVRVTDTSNGSYSDASNSNFIIVGFPDCDVTVTSPNGAESWEIGSSHSISWSASGNDCGSSVKLEYSTNGGTLWSNIISSTSNDGSYPWTIPDVPTTQARVRVTDTSNGSYSDTSNSNFEISEKTKSDGGGDGGGGGCFIKTVS